jgi:hypothetical protein
MNNELSTWQPYSGYVNNHKIEYKLPPGPAINSFPQSYVDFNNPNLKYYLTEDGAKIALILDFAYGYYRDRWDRLSDLDVGISAYSCEGRQRWSELSKFGEWWYNSEAEHQKKVLWTSSYYKETGTLEKIGGNWWYHDFGYKPSSGPESGKPKTITDRISHETYILFLDPEHFLIVNFNYDEFYKRGGLEQKRILARQIIEGIKLQ